MYSELVSALGELLTQRASAMEASVALHLVSPFEPGASSDYLAQIHLSEFTNRLRDAEVTNAQDIALRAIDDSYKFLSERRWERLRQARNTFNAALALVILGTVVLIAGVVLLYVNPERMKAGIITSTGGAISNIISLLIFKLNRDANDRLDKVKVDLAKLETLRIAVENAGKIEDSSTREAAIHNLAKDVRRLLLSNS